MEKVQFTDGKGKTYELYPGSDLSGVDLRKYNIDDADLSGANLSGSDLSKSYLNNVDLSGANLTDADILGAYLINVNLTGADLTNASLSDIHVTDVNFSGTDLTNASFDIAGSTWLPSGWEYNPAATSPRRLRHDVAWVAEQLADYRPDLELLTVLYTEHPEMSLEELRTITATVEPVIVEVAENDTVQRDDLDGVVEGATSPAPSARRIEQYEQATSLHQRSGEALQRSFDSLVGQKALDQAHVHVQLAHDYWDAKGTTDDQNLSHRYELVAKAHNSAGKKFQALYDGKGDEASAVQASQRAAESGRKAADEAYFPGADYRQEVQLADINPDTELLTTMINEHPELSLEQLGALAGTVEPEAVLFGDELRVADPAQVVYDEVLEENFLLNDDTRETFTYDERDNLLSGTDEYGHVQIFEYDEHDNVISMGNLDGNVVSYTYDIEDRRLGEVYADGLATSFSYDKDGTIHVETQDWKQGTIRDETIYPSGLTISETKTYNEAGQLIEHVHDGPKGPLTTTYEYDAKGNAIKAITTQPDGTVSVKKIDPPTDEREIGGPTR